MSSTLWIPCFNEGDQSVTYKKGTGEIWQGTRNTIYETLKLLKPKIDTGVFGRVIVTNDGSNDNTLEGIQRFQVEENVRKSVFHVIDGVTNEGKMMRFFEVFEMSYGFGDDILVMTDGDMVRHGGDTFNKLANPDLFQNQGMIVSHQGEYCPRRRRYDISDLSTSGTRSLLMQHVNAKFQMLGVGSHNLPGKGYGLELFLNTTLVGTGSAPIYVNQNDTSTTPLFLEPFRGKRGDTQSEDVCLTRRTLRKMAIL